MDADERGTEQLVTPKQDQYFAPRLSPNGQSITYLISGPEEPQVWVLDLRTGASWRLTTEGRAGWPIWTHDGKRILFVWMRSISSNLYWQPYDGSLQMELLVKVDPAHLGASPGSCSPDGKKVAVLENTGTDLNIAVLEISTGITTPFLNSKFRESYPDISPDGRWIAYTSDESKRDEVWLRPFPPNPGGKHQVSSDGGVAPLWSRDGKRLFYRWRDQMWVAEVGNENGFTSKPRLLFQKRYGTTSPIRGYDLSLDGKRFLMVKAGQPRNTPVTEMILVQNWFEELKRLVPTGNK